MQEIVFFFIHFGFLSHKIYFQHIKPKKSVVNSAAMEDDSCRTNTRWS